MATTDSPIPLNYSLVLSADFFSGGVDTGGLHWPRRHWLRRLLPSSRTGRLDADVRKE
jgi:hypothetical protein